MILIFPAKTVFPQELNIVPYLKKIEGGESEKVISELPELKQNYPHSSSVLFLDAVLTKDGKTAVDKYINLEKEYPQSKYADAALYRIYSYYYAGGMYNISKKYIEQLKGKYPNSPYIDIANKNIPSNDNIILADDNGNQTETILKKKAENISAASGFSIQAGAFTVADNADNLKQKIEQSGYNARIEAKEIGGADFHIVYIDGFKTRDKAEKVLKLINSKFSLSGRVIEQSGNNN